MYSIRSSQLQHMLLLYKMVVLFMYVCIVGACMLIYTVVRVCLLRIHAHSAVDI